MSKYINNKLSDVYGYYLCSISVIKSVMCVLLSFYCSSWQKHLQKFMHQCVIQEKSSRLANYEHKTTNKSYMSEAQNVDDGKALDDIFIANN